MAGRNLRKVLRNSRLIVLSTVQPLMQLILFAYVFGAVAQSIARELGPKNIHVAHLVVDSSVDTEWVRQLIANREGPQALENLDPNRLMRPAAVAEAYWQLYQQPRDAWSFEHEIRPFGEKW